MEKLKIDTLSYNIEFKKAHYSGDIEFVIHPGTVVCILKVKDKYLLVHQYRAIFDKWFYELPGGVIKQNEKVDDAIKREFEEETGFILKQFDRLLSLTSSVGLSNEIIHIFKAKAAEKIGKPHPEDDEIFELVWKNADEIMKMIGNGEIMDGKTITGLLYEINKNATQQKI